MEEYKGGEVVYYKSPFLENNKEGIIEKHFHIILGKHYNDISKHTLWYQIVGTSRDIKKYPFCEIVTIDPNECAIFSKTTLFDVGNIREVKEKDMHPLNRKGDIPQEIYTTIVNKIAHSKRVTPIVKIRLGIEDRSDLFISEE